MIGLNTYVSTSSFVKSFLSIAIAIYIQSANKRQVKFGISVDWPKSNEIMKLETFRGGTFVWFWPLCPGFGSARKEYLVISQESPFSLN